MCIERTEKALFVTPEIWVHPQQSTDGDKEGIFDRGVISPKTNSLSGSVITSTMIRKFQGHRYPSVQIGKPDFSNRGCFHEQAGQSIATRFKRAQCITIV